MIVAIVITSGMQARAHPALADERDRATLEGRIALGMFVAGGATLITGVVLAMANHPVRVVPNVAVAPHGDGLTVGAGWRF